MGPRDWSLNSCLFPGVGWQYTILQLSYPILCTSHVPVCSSCTTKRLILVVSVVPSHRLGFILYIQHYKVLFWFFNLIFQNMVYHHCHHHHHHQGLNRAIQHIWWHPLPTSLAPFPSAWVPWARYRSGAETTLWGNFCGTPQQVESQHGVAEAPMSCYQDLPFKFCFNWIAFSSRLWPQSMGHVLTISMVTQVLCLTQTRN